MPVINLLAAAMARAREAITRLELAGENRAREEARLAEARQLDADEVGRRADERRRAREEASGRLGQPAK